MLYVITSANADVDAEDLIARGYTCSLARTQPRLHLNTDSRRYVCDDGICIECVLTGEKAKPVAEFLDDPEDYLKAGFACTPYNSRIPHLEAGIVCDDGFCFECKKPAWIGKRGDLDIYLRGGHKCFNVDDVPEDVLKENVRVVCDDGYCFGCIEHLPITSTNEEARVLTEPLPVARLYQVTRHFLDEAEDLLDDGYYCGLTNQINIRNRFGKERVVCEGSLCLVCRLASDVGGKEKLVAVSEFVVERAKDLVDISFKCSAVLERIDVKSDVFKKVLCDTEMCFVCKSEYGYQGDKTFF